MTSLGPREALITLNLIPGLGSVRIQELLNFFGSAELALAAPHGVLEQVPRIGPKLARAIASWRDCTNVHAELALAADCGVRVVTLIEDDYPAALRRMGDPPIVLYVRGEWQQKDSERSVAIVGTRAATPYGMTLARRFGRELADSGCTIISGLARGIDSAAHWGALDAGGRTIAVLGYGMAGIYPQENIELVENICNGHGAVVSEFPMTLRPGRTTFPQRNRIVAAWSRAVLVAEAPNRSGALHTASMAADSYGNTVFAVPGPIDRPSSIGCHALIRDGAILCTGPQELMADMHWSSAPQQLELFPTEQADEPAAVHGPADCPNRDEILAAIAAGHDTLDTLCTALGLGAMTLTPQLMRLQIEQAIRPLPGGRYICC
ncbi:MAG: DNA-processing protein DprA [Akkermansia sp.]|nr:DNA-processing protein DprA [Akkermansia sp.]